MLLLLFSQQTRGQAVLRIIEPNPHSVAENPFFALSVKRDALTPADTIKRIAHVYSGTKRVLSLKIFLIPNDSAFVSQIAEVKVLDTALITLFPQQVDSSLLKSYRVTLVNKALIDQEFPTEASRSFGARGVKVNAGIKADSLLPGILKGPLVSVSGTLTTTSQLGNTSYAYQTVPQNYIRQSAEITAKIGGVPFTTSYLVSSEGGVATNNINNLGLSIDFNSMKKAILKEIEAKEQKKRDSLLSQQTMQDQYQLDLLNHARLRQKIDSLKHAFNTPEYQDQLTADSLAMLEISDTNNLDYKQKISKKRLETSRNDRKLLDDYQLAYDQFEVIRKRRALTAAIETDDLKLSKELDSRKYNPLKKIAIKSVRRIDIGNFIPNYSELILSGTNVTGINLELNPGIVYIAAMAGQQKAYDLNSPSLSKRNIGAAKLGLGKVEKLLFTFNILSGEVTGQPAGAEMIRGNERYNLATGFTLNYHYNHLFNSTVEYARSVSKFSGQAKPELEETIAKENFGNAAYTARINGATLDNKTRYAAEFKYVEPYFNSFGTPNLRKDNLRYEFRINQALIKNNVSCGAVFTHDNDNVSNTKINTSSENRLTLNLNVRYKKYPYFLISYSPAKQKVYATGSGLLYASQLHFVTISSGYNQKTRTGNSFTNLTYSFFSSSIAGNESARTVVNQVMCSNITFFQKANRNLKSSLSAYRYSNSDSIAGMRLDVGIDKTNKDGTFTYEFGAAYQWDKNIETRYIVYTEVRAALKYRISFSARLEQHLISKYHEGLTDQAQLARIIISKSF